MTNYYKQDIGSKFKSQYKKLIKSGQYKASDIQAVLILLLKPEELPGRYRDHKLIGQKRNVRELHINPDWLLIYLKDEEARVIYLIETGSHSDLFGNSGKQF